MSSDSDLDREPMTPECCTWLLEAWLARAKEDAARDVSDNVGWSPKTLPTNVRSMAWRMCKLMKATGEGTPSLAARLFERYLAVSTRNSLTTLAMVADKTGKNLSQLCETAWVRALTRMPLTLMSCVQIAGKMTGVNAALSAKRARFVLSEIGRDFSLDDVTTSEHAVFALLGYRVPLWTSLEAAELLATRLGVWATCRKAITASVRLAELGRTEVERRVCWAGRLPDNRQPVTGLQLAAGAVGAAVRLQSGGADNTRVVDEMAALIESPRALVRCVADIIVALALE